MASIALPSATRAQASAAPCIPVFHHSRTQHPLNTWRLCGLPLVLASVGSRGRVGRILRIVGRWGVQPRWSAYNAGYGVELNDEETMAKRVDHYGRAEGHCIVISETPVKSKTTANGRDFYAEIKMETDSDSWSSGMDMGLTLLSPDVVGQANEQGLCWAEFPDTWVFRGDGMLRINGRAYPPGAMPGQCAMMQGWNTAALEWGDTCGLQIRKGGSEIVGYRNGEEIGCLELDEVIQVPTDQELYLICDVIGRAGEVEILDVNVPAAEPEAPAEVEVPAVVPAAPKVEVAAAVNPFLEIMQRRPPMYR